MLCIQMATVVLVSVARPVALSPPPHSLPLSTTTITSTTTATTITTTTTTTIIITTLSMITTISTITLSRSPFLGIHYRGVVVGGGCSGWGTYYIVKQPRI